MKNIVTVCRSITEEIESQENTLFTETKNALYELKTRFSVSLSDLLVAAKYHASGMGISPVSLLDRSAGHLTFVIVELVKLLGMTSSSPTTTSNKKPITTTANDYTRRPSVSTTTTAVERNEYSNGREKNSYYGSIISGKSSNAQNHHKSTASSVATNDGPPMMRSQLDTIGYKYSNNSNNDSSMYSSAKKQQQQQPYRKNSHGSEDLTPEELVVSIALLSICRKHLLTIHFLNRNTSRQKQTISFKPFKTSWPPCAYHNKTAKSTPSSVPL